MARAFRRHGDGYDVRLDDVESVLLVELAGDVLRLLDEASPDDEVLARLFPDGYRDDPTAAAELRELIHDDLAEGKRAALRTLMDSFAERDDKGRLLLDPETAEVWLTALNDIRLSLGTRLHVTEDVTEVTEDDDGLDDELDELPDDDPTAYALSVYSWLGWLQEGLVEALMPTVQR